MTTAIDAIRLSRDDNVATVLRAVAPGEAINVRGPDGVAIFEAAGPLPLCHKVALQMLSKGTAIVKYGQPIGTLVQDAAPGDLVHVHNMISNRGRRV